MKTFSFVPGADLVFDAKVVLLCRSCKRYGIKSTCPPFCSTGDFYYNTLRKFKHGILIADKFVINKDAMGMGHDSSMAIYKEVIETRDRVVKSGHYFAIGFGAGSCKLCKKCSFPCRRPQKALVPLEATGIDVVATCKKFGIQIKFPVGKTFYRVGAVFYD